MNHIWLSHCESWCCLIVFLWLPCFTRSQGNVKLPKQLQWPLSVPYGHSWTFSLSLNFPSVPPAVLEVCVEQVPKHRVGVLCDMRQQWEASPEPGRCDVNGLGKSQAGHLAGRLPPGIAPCCARACRDRRGKPAPLRCWCCPVYREVYFVFQKQSHCFLWEIKNQLSVFPLREGSQAKTFGKTPLLWKFGLLICNMFNRDTLHGEAILTMMELPENGLLVFFFSFFR